jgi:tripartite-type tricarboxylate transporter receptor subunit TctC
MKRLPWRGPWLLLLVLALAVGCATSSTGRPAATAAPATVPPAAAVVPSAPRESAPAATTGTPAFDERAVASFYRGKTVRIVVGYAAGAGYDLFARVTSRHLGKYLPGNPAVIVENMPGAGSLVAANHLYNVAPKDGTVIATFDPALILAQAVGGGSGGIQFDPAKYPWLGSPTISTNICMMATSTGIDSVEKLIASPRELAFGSTGMGGATAIQPAIFQHYLGAKAKLVTGYDGVAKVKLAVESGELDGSCGTWESFKSSHADWLSASPPVAKVISKGKPEPAGDLPGVPVLADYLPNDEARQVYAMAMAPQAMGFVWAAAPGTPPARLKALRLAVVQTWNDSEYQADATKSSLAPLPQDYQVIERLVTEMVSAPEPTLRRAREVLGIQ